MVADRCTKKVPGCRLITISKQTMRPSTSEATEMMIFLAIAELLEGRAGSERRRASQL